MGQYEKSIQVDDPHTRETWITTWKITNQGWWYCLSGVDLHENVFEGDNIGTFSTRKAAIEAAHEDLDNQHSED